MRMDVDGVGGGEMMRAMTHYVHGNAGGRAIDVFPPGIPKVVFYPIPLRESQRDCNCGDGRGPVSPSGNAGGRAIAVFPPGIRRSHVAPSPSGNPNGILP